MRPLPVVLAALLCVPALALATPLRCADPCVVGTSNAGYSPPVVEVASGGSVVWRSTGGGHIQSDVGQAPECFVTFVASGGTSGPARFDVRGGALWANTTELGDVACLNAQRLPTGGFVLPYECTIHPSMRGAIVVQG
ncbi:MAG TPA: hypothetical protein VFH47_05030 [Candidatus Thermoplasmatota archaeon]|nr:hypothetical protein [Candidatus Thermoplasmatota archaeon]